jgi:hypothetical protein
MMQRSIGYFSFLLGLCLVAAAYGQAPGDSKLRLLLSEVGPRAMSADQYCTLVFADHRFHSEKANRHHGRDTDRKIYEGKLSDAEWNALDQILENKDFRDLTIPPSVPPLVMQDTHPYNISVARDSSYQNMEFLNTKSMKPYEPQIRPLLQWWKELRAQRPPESKAAANPSCSLDSTHGIFSQ